LPGSVIILSAEDDLDDTIRPRLDAAGADPRRVFVLPSIADLRHDFAKLREAIDRAPDCRLIVIDPVNAYVGPSDSHFHTVVRRVFKPLVKLAVKKGIAILAVTHLRKNEGAAIQRAAGSMGFVAAARAVWTVCRDQAHPGRNLLLPLKHNLVADPFGLAYTIESPAPLAAPAVAWQSAAVTTSATDALAAAKKPRGPEADELRAATDWLRGELAPGPREAHRIIFEGALAGFSERTLRRALYALEGATIKRDFRDGWSWSVPPAPGQPTTPRPAPKQLGPFDETWPLRENNENSSPAPALAPIPGDQPTDPQPAASCKRPPPPTPPPPKPAAATHVHAS
jgi:putative DNA primase/helicase